MSNVQISASVHNNHIHLQFIRDSNIVFLFTHNNRFKLYIGPYTQGVLYCNDSYHTEVDSYSYRKCIGTYLNLCILSNYTLVDNLYRLIPIDDIILQKHTLNDSWEWLELMQEGRLRCSTEIGLYQYFSTMSNSLASLQECIKEEVVQVILYRLDMHFPDITAPNKDCITNLHIMQNPIVIEIIEEVKLKTL